MNCDSRIIIVKAVLTLEMTFSGITSNVLFFSAEVDDYNIVDHPPGYVSEFKMLPKQTPKQEEKICEIHKTLL